MQLEINREVLLSALQRVIGAIERKQTDSSLSNILLQSDNGVLRIVGTDTELEIITKTDIHFEDDSAITVPGKKLFEICRSAFPDTNLIIEDDQSQVRVKSGKSRFMLSTSSVENFPLMGSIEFVSSLTISENSLKFLLEKVSFSMANQDVRYFLNGCLLEFDQGCLKCVATDGHRLALSYCDVDLQTNPYQVILTRKTILELQRLLSDDEALAEIVLGERHFCLNTSRFNMTSKIIDGRFPDYSKVIPKSNNKHVVINKDVLKKCLSRVSILSSDRYQGVRLFFKDDLLIIRATNPEQESAEEEIDLEYRYEELEIAFNVNYLIDIVNIIDYDSISFYLNDSNSSCLIRHPGNDFVSYVLMPMRL